MAAFTTRTQMPAAEGRDGLTQEELRKAIKEHCQRSKLHRERESTSFLPRAICAGQEEGLYTNKVHCNLYCKFFSRGQSIVFTVVVVSKCVIMTSVIISIIDKNLRFSCSSFPLPSYFLHLFTITSS